MPWHAPRTSLIRAGLLLALAFTACRRASGPAPERYLSADTVAAVVIPELRQAAAQLAALDGTLSTFPGAGQQLAGVRGALTAQLGFDPLDAAAMSGVGLEPRRGAALGYELPADAGGAAVGLLILPVRDAGALERLVARLARERLGAPVRSASERSGLQIVTFHASAGGPAALTLGLLASQHTALLAPGPGGPAVVARAASRPEAASLAALPAWRELRAALGDRRAVLAASILSGRREAEHGEIEWPRDLFPRGLALAISAEAGALQLSLATLPDAQTLEALRAGGDSRAAIRALSGDAALVLRWDGDPAELGKHVVARVPAHDREWLAAHGLDLQADLFDQLAPGAAASVSLAPRLDLTDLSDTALRADPLRVIRFEVVGDVKDEASARRTLIRLPALAAALAAPAGAGSPKAAPPDPGGAGGRIATPSGEIAWRLSGKRLALAGGPAGALDALLARQQGPHPGPATPTEASRAALEGGLGGAVLLPRNLVASVRALPEDAFGTGPTGFVVRSMVERFLEPAERITAASARVAIAGKALRIDVQVDVPPPSSREAAR